MNLGLHPSAVRHIQILGLTGSDALDMVEWWCNCSPGTVRMLDVWCHIKNEDRRLLFISSSLCTEGPGHWSASRAILAGHPSLSIPTLLCPWTPPSESQLQLLMFTSCSFFSRCCQEWESWLVLLIWNINICADYWNFITVTNITHTIGQWWLSSHLKVNKRGGRHGIFRKIWCTKLKMDFWGT